MNIKVCLYCNMNYIFSYKIDNSYKTIADLDHFYIKSEFPEYALCLYNFIPACTVCNSRLKLQRSMNINTHIYPFSNGFEEKAKFEISNLTEVLLYNHKPEIKLNLFNDDHGKVKNSIDIFKTEDLYQNHKEYAQELLENTIAYNENYQNELCGILDINDIKTLIFGNEIMQKDIKNISLGMFKSDLLKQFGVY